MAEFGDLYLVRGDGVIGKLIRYFTRSRFSHGGVVIWGGMGVEATWGGVRVVKLAERYKDKEIVYLAPKAPLEKGERRLLGTFLYDRVKASFDGEEGYDIKGLLGFVFFKRWQNPKNWYCFELQYVAYKYIGRELARLDHEYIDGTTIYGSLELKVRE